MKILYYIVVIYLQRKRIHWYITASSKNMRPTWISGKPRFELDLLDHRWFWWLQEHENRWRMKVGKGYKANFRSLDCTNPRSDCYISSSPTVSFNKNMSMTLHLQFKKPDVCWINVLWTNQTQIKLLCLTWEFRDSSKNCITPVKQSGSCAS